MLTLKELIGKGNPTINQESMKNLQVLLERINLIRAEWGRPMTVTSGFRTMADHLRIYRQKGIFNEKLVPMKSRHLIGAAVDILDVSGELMKWLLEDESRLERAELWCEKNTSGWVHFQIFPPKSGERWFVA